MILHAGLIALRLGGYWRGVLIEGPSGAGKSDLALRCLGGGFALVADDRVVLFNSEGRVFGRAPPVLAGLIEVRGVGVTRHSSVDFAQVVLRVRCASGPEEVERFPQPRAEFALGANLPVLTLWPFERSAPAKMRRALEHLGEGRQQAYQACLAPPRRREGAAGTSR
jgi:serine kinase of HPr protein (carbohydrate metabolism regulator)